MPGRSCDALTIFASGSLRQAACFAASNGAGCRLQSTPACEHGSGHRPASHGHSDRLQFPQRDSFLQGGLLMLSRILEYLDQNKVAYSHHAHPDAYTAREVASAEHVPTHEVAKIVVFVEGDGYGMAVLGADCAVDMYELRMFLGQPRLRLATEAELAKLFPQCELGAMPPFGNLFHMPVYADSRLAREGMIEFNAGTHRDVVRLRYRDYENLVKPGVLDLARVVAP